MRIRNSVLTRQLILAAAVAAAVQTIPGAVARAGTSTNTSGPVQQGSSTGDPANNYPAITISFSGQTALRTFNNSQGISTLQPGNSISLNFGPTGNIPVTYYASTTPGGYVQLAKK